MPPLGEKFGNDRTVDCHVHEVNEVVQNYNVVVHVTWIDITDIGLNFWQTLLKVNILPHISSHIGIVHKTNVCVAASVDRHTLYDPVQAFV